MTTKLNIMENIKIYKNDSGRLIHEINYEYYNNHPELKLKKSSQWIINDLKCDFCKKTFCRSLKKFNYTRERRKGHEWEGMIVCSIKCFNSYIHNFEEWRKHNSEAQLIAQNKPEQKIRNSEGVKKSRKDPVIYKKWYDASVKAARREASRKKQSENLKKRWRDPIEREKFINNGKFFTSCHGDFISKFSGKIRYESSYELLFLFLCDLNKQKVERFDLPIKYIFNGEEHIYFPDFIIKNTIFEIKSHVILKKEKKGEMFKEKEKAAKKFISNSDIYTDFKVLFEENLNKNNILDSRSYIFSWLLKENFIKNNYGGKSMMKRTFYTEDFNNTKFNAAKEFYLKWKSL